MFRLITLLLFLSCQRCHGYNIDLVSPLVINSGLNTTSYSFGFSIAHHWFSDTNEKVLLVGAPKAVYNATGLREGGVYICPLIHGETCRESAVFNSRKNAFEPPFFDTFNFADDDDFFANQLMGYSVKSKNNSVMACAPLFIGGDTIIGGLQYHETTGRCATLPQNFNDATVPSQLFQFDTVRSRVAGVGAEIFQPDSASNDIFHAVGTVRSGDSPVKPGGVYLMNAGYSTGQIAGIEERTPFPSTTNDQLQGYHIEQGHILQNTTEDLVASGPKAENHRGQIKVYTRNLNDAHVILGPESSIDGYFGFDFALVDFQLDGYDSLVVGCPLCDEDKGLVYVYTHTKDRNNPFNESGYQAISLPGNSQQQGQFGMAVENIGDVDQDGFEDVAVSAPYQDMGVVYVFRGGRNGLITDTYQVIPAPAAGSENFGYVITAGGDVDSNMYPDFTVGDLSSKAVYTYRSSPVIDVGISTKETDLTLDYSKRNCLLQEQNIPSICFNITPCFNFSTNYGGVDEFAVKYTLIVDEQQQRVGLQENILTNRVTREVTVRSSEPRTCDRSHTFLLVPFFSTLDTIPLSISITNADSLLPLSSPDSAIHGGDLHPIMSLTSNGSSLQLQVVPNYVQNCGSDNICDPDFTVTVEHNIPTDDNIILWASGFTFSLTIQLNNIGEDSLASEIVINAPAGIQFSDSESITDFAVSSCESQRDIRCPLKNPIIANETVEFRIFFRPNALETVFDGEDLSFTFTVMQSGKPRGTASMSLSARSMASYEVRGSFGVEQQQATRFNPSANQSSMALTSQGPTINYQVTISHTGYNDEESPVPSLIINVVWPGMLTVEGGEIVPLLVPTGIVIIGSDSTTCRQFGAIPSHLLQGNQQSPLVLPNITADTPTNKQCPNNVTCGIIQCQVLNLRPQLRDAATPPIQISIFSTLWSNAIRDTLNISIQAETYSQTTYPSIQQSIISALTTILLQPAVTETQRDCFQLWIVIVSIIGGLVLAFILVLIFALCGCFGRGYYKKKRESEQREKIARSNSERRFSQGYIPGPDVYTKKTTTEDQHEDEIKTINGADTGPAIPESFAPYSEITNSDEQITDEVVMKTAVLNPMAITASGTDVADGGGEQPDLETEI